MNLSVWISYTKREDKATEETVPSHVYSTFTTFMSRRNHLDGAMWEKVFFMILAGNSVVRKDCFSLNWEEGQLEQEHTMAYNDGFCSFRQELELRGWGQVGALREGEQTLWCKPNKSQETAVAMHLSPAGSIIWCRTCPFLGLKFFICPKGVLYLLLLSHRLLLGWNKIMDLRRLLSTII